MARVVKATPQAAATRARAGRVVGVKPPAKKAGKKVSWPIFSIRLDPAIVAVLDRELPKLGKARSEWGREVLSEAAARLAKTRGTN